MNAVDAQSWDAIPKQKYVIGNSEGIMGDCWRCCVAAVIGLPAEDVPHFVQGSADPMGDTQKWLNERGAILVGVRGKPFDFTAWWDESSRESLALQLPVIQCGPTARTRQRGQHHAVVSYKGELVYDPHPDATGLIWNVEEYLIVNSAS